MVEHHLSHAASAYLASSWINDEKILLIMKIFITIFNKNNIDMDIKIDFDDIPKFLEDWLNINYPDQANLFTKWNIAVNG